MHRKILIFYEFLECYNNTLNKCIPWFWKNIQGNPQHFFIFYLLSNNSQVISYLWYPCNVWCNIISLGHLGILKILSLNHFMVLVITLIQLNQGCPHFIGIIFTCNMRYDVVFNGIKKNPLIFHILLIVLSQWIRIHGNLTCLFNNVPQLTFFQ